MSSNAQPSPPRAGSYILVSSSSPFENTTSIPEELEPAYARPRLFWLLPLVAALDTAFAVTLGVLVLRQEAKHHEPGNPVSGDPPLHDPIMISSSAAMPDSGLDEGAAWERRKVVLAVVGFSIARAAAYAIIGISKRVRQLGVTVAAISILSTLFYLSIANLLFQARPKPDTLDTLVPSWSGLTLAENWHWPYAFRQFEPTMPILVGTQMAFTLFEWILYIAVVGVKIPPGGNPVHAKRWARGLADDPGYQRGVDAHSLYAEDAEQGAQDVDGHSVDGSSQEVDHDDADVEQGRALLSSPLSNSPRRDASIATQQDDANASNRPLLATGPVTPRGYGSTLTSPRTPQSSSHAQAQSQASVRSARSAAAPPAHSMSRSGSARSGLYSRSPGAAELGSYGGLVEDDDDDEQGEEESDGEAQGSDPDDIIDITPNRAVARKEARLRLARAALPERRASAGTLSTLNIFGGTPSEASTRGGSGSGSGGGARGPHLFSDETGSPLGKNVQDGTPPPLLSVAASPEVPRATPRPVDVSRQSSMSLLPSSSSTRTASTRASSSGKDRKFKLPKWMKPSSKRK